MVLYTSDLHFGHTNVIGFDHRPFSDRDEMDKVMIELWNNRVQKDDTVYIVGDLCYRSGYAPEWYLRQLKGHKVLILGNHDLPILNNKKALHYLDGVEKMMHIQDGDKQICLCHFPIAEWNGFFHETWHIYGHIHNNPNYNSYSSHGYCVSVERINYTPVSLEKIKLDIMKCDNTENGMH